MKRLLRTYLVILLVISLGLLSGCNNTGQQKEKKEEQSVLKGPIKILCGFAPGGANDIVARGVQPYLQEALGIPVIVENLPGAGGQIAAERFYKSEPNGDTLLIWSELSASITQLLYKPNFNLKEFTPIYKIVGGDFRVVTVSATGPYKTLDDLMKASEKKDLVAAGTGGKGSTAQIQSIYLRKAGLNHKFVAYDGGAEGSAAIMGGHADFGLDSSTAAIRYVKDGRIKVVGIHAPERSPLFPDTPTFKELKYQSPDLPYNVGIYAPPGTPKDIASVLEEGFKKATSNPEFIKWAMDSGVLISPASAAEWKKSTDDWFSRTELLLPEIESYK